MALFSWQCTECDQAKRSLCPTRPILPECPECGAEQVFVTNVSSLVQETMDNGIMPRKVERLKDVESLIHDHVTTAPDDGIV